MVTKVVKVLIFIFVSEIPSHDFCCAYLERQDFCVMIRIFKNKDY